MKNVKDGRFSVKHFYLLLTTGQDSLFLFCFAWNSWVPTKFGFFAWEASWGKVLTIDQLKKRCRSLANKCFLYGEETVHHLLIHYLKAKILLDLLLAIYGVSWVFHLSVKEALLS